MPDAFVIEISGRAAGIAAATGRRFRFQAVSPSLSKLEGKSFETIEALRLKVQDSIAGTAQNKNAQQQVICRRLY